MQLYCVCKGNTYISISRSDVHVGVLDEQTGETIRSTTVTMPRKQASMHDESTSPGRPWARSTHEPCTASRTYHRSLRAWCTVHGRPCPNVRSQDDDDLLFSPQCFFFFTPSPCTVVPRVSWLTRGCSILRRVRPVVCWPVTSWACSVHWRLVRSAISLRVDNFAASSDSSTPFAYGVVRMHACPHDSCVACRHAVRLFRAIVLLSLKAEAELFWLAERLAVKDDDAWNPEFWWL